MPDIAYETLFNPTQEALAPVRRGLHTFNQAHVGEGVIQDYHKVAIFAKDENGAVIGGVHGEMFWDWLHVDTLWVDEAHRGKGIGSRLMRQIEDVATAKGFHGSHLETTDFQALDFYRRNGYQVFGQIEGKPAGSTWYYLKKDL